MCPAQCWNLHMTWTAPAAMVPLSFSFWPCPAEDSPVSVHLYRCLTTSGCAVRAPNMDLCQCLTASGCVLTAPNLHFCTCLARNLNQQCKSKFHICPNTLPLHLLANNFAAKDKVQHGLCIWLDRQCHTYIGMQPNSNFKADHCAMNQ